MIQPQERQKDQSTYFARRLAHTELVAIVGLLCVARFQKPVHASECESTVDRLFRATVNVRGRRACVRVARLLPKL